MAVSNSSYMAVFECKPANVLHDFLMDGGGAWCLEARKCIIQTLSKAQKVAQSFDDIITQDLVERFVRGEETEEEWESMRRLSLLVLVTHHDKREEEHVYSFSHAKWLESVRSLRLRHNTMTDSLMQSQLMQVMSEFQNIQRMTLTRTSGGRDHFRCEGSSC